MDGNVGFVVNVTFLHHLDKCLFLFEFLKLLVLIKEDCYNFQLYLGKSDQQQ